MLEVALAINCEDEECIGERLRKAREAGAAWLHLDVADGRFTFNRNWSDPEAWKRWDVKQAVEVHLMVEEPEKVAEAWASAGARRLVIHLESLSDKRFRSEPADPKTILDKMLGMMRPYGTRLMLAINPETHVSALRPFVSRIGEFQIFSQAHPGPAGQPFLPSVLPKIAELRKEYPEAIIEVDGGMNPETARQAKAAGANVIVAGSYVWRSENPKAAYHELLSL